MKKWFSAVLVFFVLTLFFRFSPFSLASLASRLTLRLCENEAFCEVFGLSEEEAVRVFADETEAAFL